MICIYRLLYYASAETKDLALNYHVRSQNNIVLFSEKLNNAIFTKSAIWLFKEKIFFLIMLIKNRETYQTFRHVRLALSIFMAEILRICDCS